MKMMSSLSTVPANHTIDATLSLNESVAVYIELVDGNLGFVDYAYSFGATEGSVSTFGTSYDGVGGTYYVNLSRSGTGVNWTLDIWTNYSTPAPNLVIENITAPLAASAGNSITLDVEVNNTGTQIASRILTYRMAFS